MAPRSSPRKTVTVNYNEDAQSTPVPQGRAKTDAQRPKQPGKTPQKNGKRKAEPEPEGPAKPSAKASAKKEDDDTPHTNGTLPKKRKTTAKPKGDEMPLAERTAPSSLKHAMYIGAHVSAAGGVQNSVNNALHIGANSFALFLKSQRKWDNPPLTAESTTSFLSGCKHHSVDQAKHCLPHGSYLVNLAQKDTAKGDQAYKSFLEDLQRCESLGIRLYNFHPGSTGGEPRAEAIGRIAKRLNDSHKATASVVTVLENMAGGGNVIGSTWEDLRDVIAQVDDKERVGVCIDTCHAFAAGYDLRNPEAYRETMEQFEAVVGKNYLKAFHLNDSKAPFSSHRDLHANIGTGFLGLRAFHSIMNDASLPGLPMVLETPIDKKDEKGKTVEDKQVWADEIKLLESLIGMDPDTDAFTGLCEELQEKGEAERSRVQGQVDKKAAKGSSSKADGGGKGKSKAKGKGKGKTATTDDESE